MDNLQLRALFSLPPILVSASTALAVPELPPKAAATGDPELDAVLWLREVIKFGQQDLVDKAMEAFRLIKTPAKELETRYTNYVRRTSGGHFGAVLMSFGFADLEGLAKSSMSKAQRQREAISRFGSEDRLFEATPAEVFCIETLNGLKVPKNKWSLNPEKVSTRFQACSELIPHTLADCIYELQYWHELRTLRYAYGVAHGDPRVEIDAREDFVFGFMATIQPATKDEALAVFDHLFNEQKMDRTQSPAILRNVIAGGWSQ